ncbi:MULTISPECIES: ATP-dependent DNA ligase [unclassified Streptomyces]|uniref:ATP-dependent DNA ligase n=1 Tax=unclassified Streptomyces TaxID=2593676 RepID=UPI002E337982|nr:MULTISPECIES: hypothetical protein [unclassified Streptomyces]
MPPGRVGEPKWDGIRALLHTKAGRAVLRSRRGTAVRPVFPDIAAAAAQPRDATALDGELVVWEKGLAPRLGRCSPICSAPAHSAVRQRVTDPSLSEAPCADRQADLAAAHGWAPLQCVRSRMLMRRAHQSKRAALVHTDAPGACRSAAPGRVAARARSAGIRPVTVKSAGGGCLGDARRSPRSMSPAACA